MLRDGPDPPALWRPGPRPRPGRPGGGLKRRSSGPSPPGAGCGVREDTSKPLQGAGPRPGATHGEPGAGAGPAPLRAPLGAATAPSAPAGPRRFRRRRAPRDGRGRGLA